MDRKGELPFSLIDKYLLKRAAGFTRVCFQSYLPVGHGLHSWNRRFFRIKLPQLAAAFAKYHVQLELQVCQGGGHMFFSYLDMDAPEDILDSQRFSPEYWEVLSPVLTKLDLTIGDDEIEIESNLWLNSMKSLQHLELRGVDAEDSVLPALDMPAQLSLPALKLLRLEKLVSVTDSRLDCPSLEALHIREVVYFCMPTGLGSCTRLITLDVAATMDTVHDADESLRLSQAIESVQSTLEVLDISGWGFASNVFLDLISRLPRLHTLVAQRNGLTVVPALPATLKTLDLRANGITEVPVQLESLTQLTSLALSSEDSSVNFQIQRPLDAIISLPHLRELTLALATSVYGPGFTVWGARSLYYLGLAQHEIDRTNSTLLLKF